MRTLLLISLCAVLSASDAGARKDDREAEDPVRTSVWSDVVSKDYLDPESGLPALPASAVAAPVNRLMLSSY